MKNPNLIALKVMLKGLLKQGKLKVNETKILNIEQGGSVAKLLESMQTTKLEMKILEGGNVKMTDLDNNKIYEI